MNNSAKQATPAAELERQIMSASEPKNEREWWAQREIEQLRSRVADLEGWNAEIRVGVDALKNIVRQATIWNAAREQLQSERPRTLSSNRAFTSAQDNLIAAIVRNRD